MLNPAYTEEHSDAFDLGTAVHAYLLEGETTFAIIDAPDWRTKVAKEARDLARTQGQTPLLAHRWASVQAMAAAVRAQLAVCEPPIPLREGMPERSLFWTENGVECRATPDWLHHDVRTIDDLKTTAGSGHPAVFSRALWDRGYDLQAALYLRAVKRTHGTDAAFRFVVCEVDPPYAVSVVALDPEALAFANLKLDRALALWAQCLATNDWPAYPTRTCYAELPPYLQAQWAERSYYDGVLVSSSDS